MSDFPASQSTIGDLEQEVERLRLASEVSLRLNASNDLTTQSGELSTIMSRVFGCRSAVLWLNPETDTLTPGYNPHEKEIPRQPISVTEIPQFSDWLDGKPRVLQAEALSSTGLTSLIAAITEQAVIVVPIMSHGGMPLVGILILATSDTSKLYLLDSVISIAAVSMRNAIAHSRVVDQLAAKTQELALTRRIDRELNDTMKQSHVLEITLDWAMRVTTATATSLALYDQATDELRYAIDLGYQDSPDKITLVRSAMGNGIAHRVARSGHTEVIPDVSLDQDYIELSSNVKSHMSVPVMREDRVIAVISMESKRLNAFTDEHVDFVEKLATRAGVAIDNARLYADAIREREKYSLILGTTSDAVITIGHDERILQINPAAIAALRLYPDREYVGSSISDTFEDTPLLENFRRIKALEQPAIEEILCADGKTYHANFTPHPQIGWIWVMHDISEYKQMDQLKSELIATVSHDLRQPLMVMNGYVELLTLNQQVDERSKRYIGMLSRSIHAMRRLIEDLLDLAKIDSGMQLNLQQTHIHKVIEECIENVRPSAEAKSMSLTVQVPSLLPQVLADHDRLLQVFNNLIMNAIKYTPPEGRVRVFAEATDTTLRIAVQDTGVGISPQDQARIFERFYRVRNAENESIEGTGLGLAIVKRLVEAHHGQIGLESLIGHGSTFFVMLPVHKLDRDGSVGDAVPQ